MHFSCLVFPTVDATDFVSTESGSDITISVKFTGKPKPLISWYHFEKELKNSDR